jgi:hypothetical protein
MTVNFSLVLDASAKIPSGIMNGNINQYGDFDQCIDTISPDQKIQGKYCLSFLNPRNKNLNLENLRKTIQAHEFVKNDIDDVCFI